MTDNNFTCPACNGELQTITRFQPLFRMERSTCQGCAHYFILPGREKS